MQDFAYPDGKYLAMTTNNRVRLPLPLAQSARVELQVLTPLLGGRMMLAGAAIRDRHPHQPLEIFSSEYPQNTMYVRQLARIH